MKGLLLKDWYMMKKYCKFYLVIVAVFVALSLAGNENMFFIFYPCLLCGLIPTILLGYDEQSRWIAYSGTLPYTKAQIVSAKYLISLSVQAAVLIVTGIAQGIKMYMGGAFVLDDFIALMLLMLAMATLTASIPLPFIFKLGVEKGRTAYYITIGFACGASVLAEGLIKGQLQHEIWINTSLTVFAVIGLGIYLLSWYLSIVFYKKRDLQ